MTITRLFKPEVTGMLGGLPVRLRNRTAYVWNQRVVFSLQFNPEVTFDHLERLSRLFGTKNLRIEQALFGYNGDSHRSALVVVDLPEERADEFFIGEQETLRQLDEEQTRREETKIAGLRMELAKLERKAR